MNSLVAQHCIEWNNRIIYPLNSLPIFKLINETLPIERLPATQPPFCHLIAGVYPNEIFTMSTSQTFICSTHSQIFALILKYLQCSLSFKRSPANFGGNLRNGTWTGILELFAKKQADFIPHIFSATNHRDEIIQFRNFLPAKELMTVLSVPRTVETESPGNLFSAFSASIWFTIGFFYLLYGGLHWGEALFRDNGQAYRTVGQFLFNYIEMFALLIGQGTVILSSKPEHSFLQCPLLLWIFFSFIIRTLFANFITAFLLSRTQTKLDYFNQLASRRYLKILIVERSSSYWFFKENFPRLIPQIEPITYEENNSLRTLRRVLQGDSVLISPREYGEMIQDYFHTLPFVVSKEGFVSSLGNFAMRHGLREELSRKLGRLWRDIFAFGLNGQIDKTIPMGNLLTSMRHNRTSLMTLKGTPTNAHSPENHSYLAYLYIYLIGICLSFVAFLIELFTHFGIKKTP